MAGKTDKTKARRLSRSQRKHIRRMKAENRKHHGATHASGG